MPVEGDAGKVACSAVDVGASGGSLEPSGAGASLGEVNVGASGGSLESSEDWRRRWTSGIRERSDASKLRRQEGRAWVGRVMSSET